MLTRGVIDSQFAAMTDGRVGRVLMDGEVQVWHYGLDADTESEASLERVLDADEFGRAARFRFAKHKRRYIVGRSTLRMILARYVDCEPQDLHFGYGQHGKPYIVWPNSARDIRFSASDSHGFGAVAVARRSELGLDLEQVRPNRDHELVAACQFSSEEKDWIRHLPEAERLIAFYEIWTCKEAYLKGKGLGLTVPLNRFAISVGPDKPPKLVWSDIDVTDPQHWSLHRLAIQPGFLACLAVEGGYSAIRSAVWPVRRCTGAL